MVKGQEGDGDQNAYWVRYFPVTPFPPAPTMKKIFALPNNTTLTKQNFTFKPSSMTVVL